MLLGLAQPARAQQNLFNIPAGDLTPRGKVFYQHQTNVYGLGDLESKNHFVYGLGRGWEAGLNVLNLKMDFRNRGDVFTVNRDDPGRPLKPLVQLTGQKFFVVGPALSTSLGTQVGTNPLRFGGARRRLTHFSYNTWVWSPRHHVKVVAGPYLSDRGTLGAGNRAGVLLGAEYPVSKKLLLMGDFVSGRNATSVSVLGINYLATRRVQLCLGVLLPNPGSQNRAGVVFELNLLGYDAEDDAPPGPL
ncbi:hypothetical protein GCM10022408_23120 [Hymenobacter fastidiosus]|uniref:Porin n=1 Tax=Hymenobacter fastidiosus TaxID=486264 RepID=A0ABP7SDW2_9BACT